MPEKLERCVADVKGQKGVDSAWAICTDALKELDDHPYKPPYKEAQKFPYPFPAINSKDATKESRDAFDTLDPIPSDTGHRDPTKTLDPDPIDKIEKEAVSIGGGLSAQSVGGKRHKDQKLMESLCECDTFNKLHEALIQEAEDDTEWITVKGAHIPIKKGENKDEVVKSFLAKQGGKGGGEKKTGSGLSSQSEKELISSIKAGKKDWHDWYRNDSNDKFYAEIEKRNKEIPRPKRPEGAGGTIFQDDPNAISKYESKVKYLEDMGDYWKKVTKFPARDHKTPGQLGDAKWYELSNNSANLRDTKKKLEKVKARKESGTTLERKVTYKHGKPRFYYKENPKEQETIGTNSIFDNVLNALRKETN